MVISYAITQILMLCYYQIPYIASQDQVLLQNVFYHIRGNTTPPKDVVIVSIDDKTFTELKLSTKKPIPRQVFADSFFKIQQDKPKLVVLDLFAPHSQGEEEATKKVAEAMKLGPTTLTKIKGAGNESYSDPIIVDEAFMEIPMEITYNDKYQNLRLASLISRENTRGLNPEEYVPLLKPLNSVLNSNLERPNKFDLINFYGEAGTITHYSMWELLSDKAKIPKGFFKDKIVFVGFQSNIKDRGTGNNEIFNTSLPSSLKYGEMYGVEIHANILGNLIEGNWIRSLNQITEALYFFFTIFFLILGILLLNPLSSLIHMTIYLSFWFSFSYYAFVYLNYFFPGFFFILLIAPFIFGASSCVIATQALKELKETKKMLGMKEKLG